MNLTHVPGLPPPAGITSNFFNPESRSLMIIVTSILCLVLITLISSLRFYTNIWIKRSLKADDSKYQLAPFDANRSLKQLCAHSPSYVATLHCPSHCSLLNECARSVAQHTLQSFYRVRLEPHQLTLDTDSQQVRILLAAINGTSHSHPMLQHSYV